MRNVSLRATTSRTVTSTSGTMNHAPHRPTNSTTLRSALLTLSTAGSSPLAYCSEKLRCSMNCLLFAVGATHEPQRHIGPHHHDDERAQLQDHERDDAEIDALDLDFLGRDALQIEQRKSKWWCQERCLQIDRHQDCEPVDDLGLGYVVPEIKTGDQ